MILMYHKIFPEAPTMWWVEVDSFYRQLHELTSRKVVYLDDYDRSNPDHVVLTFDGVYRNVLEYAAPLLKQFGYPFELFITSDHIGRDNGFDITEPCADFADIDELLTLVKMGGRLQWHTRSHANLGDVHDESVIVRELDIPKHIRELDHSGFGWFAYPHGEFNDDVLVAVRENFRGAVSCVQGNDDDSYLLNRVTATSQSCFAQASASVIIASYNYGMYLVEAVESVLRQTVPATEILISDDCSSDETWEIAQEYKKRYPDRIRTNRNETNLGIVAHFNKAVTLTRGEYVCILGADNRFRSDFLERTVQLLNANEKIAVAYTDFALFGTRSGVVAASFSSSWPVKKIGDKFHVVAFPDFDAKARYLLKNTNFIHGSSLFRRKAFDAVGGYQRANPLPEDYSLFRRMIDSGWGAVHCSLPLLEYRQHSRDQANIHATSEALLHHYRRQNLQIRQEIEELRAYVERTRNSFAWRIALPIRVMENLLHKWLSG